MGMYTEIFLNVDLVSGVPDCVLDTLRKGRMRDGSRFLFGNMSYYTPLTSCHELKYDDIRGAWSFIGKGDLKNYEGEIEEFFKWIQEWVDAEPGEFIGYSRYEEQLEPKLYFKT